MPCAQMRAFKPYDYDLGNIIKKNRNCISKLCQFLIIFWCIENFNLKKINTEYLLEFNFSISKSFSFFFFNLNYFYRIYRSQYTRISLILEKEKISEVVKKMRRLSYNSFSNSFSRSPDNFKSKIKKFLIFNTKKLCQIFYSLQQVIIKGKNCWPKINLRLNI